MAKPSGGLGDPSLPQPEHPEEGGPQLLLPWAQSQASLYFRPVQHSQSYE